jgi:hypothetical protein
MRITKKIYFTIFGAKMSKLWFFPKHLHHFWKSFSNFLLKSTVENAGCTRCSASAGAGGRGMRVNRPHPSARPRRGGADRRPLTDGEVSSQAKVTQMTTLTLRTRWRTRGGQRSSGDQSPPSMAERWRGWSPASHSWPRDGHGKDARAPVS